jgi:ribonuclease Z
MKKLGLVAGVLIVIAGVLYAARGPLLDRLITRQIDRTLNRVDNSLMTDGKLHVILCGTAAALPDPDRAGACTAIIAGDQFWLVDVGPSSWRNVDVQNLPVGKLSGVLITHFHSDHISDLGEAITQSWIAGRTAPLDIYGPQGLDDVVAGYQQAFSHDRQYRVEHHGADYMPPSGGTAISHPLPTPKGIDAEPVFERNGLRVSVFRVDHAPVDIAFGYRFEYRGRVVVISGDTRKSDTVIRNAQNADLLIHEALASKMTNRASARAEETGMHRIAKMAIDVRGYHTTPVEAAEVAEAAHVKKLVLTHIFPPLGNTIARQLFLVGTADAYHGPLILGADGMRIDIDTQGASTP